MAARITTTITLTVTSGGAAGRRFEFDGPARFTVGLLPTCDLTLPAGSTGVSREHMRLELDPPTGEVVDLGSTNGTWVNRTRLGGTAHGASKEPERAPFADGDVLGLGDTTLELSIEVPPGSVRPRRCLACARVTLSTDGGQPFMCELCGATVVDHPSQSYEAHAGPSGVLTAASPGPAPGGHFDGYQVVQLLGQGSMGKVYLAEREGSGERVALKVLLTDAAVDEKVRADFLREAQVASELTHPNLVRCLGQGAAGRAFWFVMEFCPGGSLQDLLRRRAAPLGVDEAVGLIAQAARGLAFMHARGFVHRDIKPQNILLTEAWGGVAKVGDFGLSKSFERITSQTATGTVFGTPHFMAREQAVDFKHVRPVSDVWSLGATLYFLLTGLTPREVDGAETMLQLVRAMMSAQQVPLAQRRPDLSPALTDVVERALAAEPDLRQPDAGAFLEDLAAANPIALR